MWENIKKIRVNPPNLSNPCSIHYVSFCVVLNERQKDIRFIEKTQIEKFLHISLFYSTLSVVLIHCKMGYPHFITIFVDNV